MHRIRIAAGIALLLLVSVSTVSAQPYVGVYFCGSGTDWQEQQDCQGIGVLDTLCVVAQSPLCDVLGIQFAIDYPPAVTWIADIDTPPMSFGTTPTGLAASWPTGQPAGSVFVTHVVVVWNCDDCQSVQGQTIRIVPHPVTGFLGLTSCGFLTVLVPMEGRTAMICRTVPVEETSWGQIKALYR